MARKSPQTAVAAVADSIEGCEEFFKFAAAAAADRLVASALSFRFSSTFFGPFRVGCREVVIRASIDGWDSAAAGRGSAALARLLCQFSLSASNLPPPPSMCLFPLWLFLTCFSMYLCATGWLLSGSLAPSQPRSFVNFLAAAAAWMTACFLPPPPPMNWPN